MSNKNTAIVVSIILSAFFIVLVVVYLQESGLNADTFDKGQRFKAKPGTTRENAMLLTSSKRASGPDTSGGSAAAADDSDPLPVKSLSQPAPDARRSGAAGELARAALNSLSPEAGLRKLDEALAMERAPEQNAILYEAQGQLYAQLDPPDYEAARASFDQAAVLAEDPVLQEEIAYTAVQMLVQAGFEAEARERIVAQLADGPPQSDTGYKLRLIEGQLQEHAGALEAAEATYQSVLDAARAMPEPLESEGALALARLAGMRLTTLYRKHDRDGEADTLSQDLRKQLARMQRR